MRLLHSGNHLRIGIVTAIMAILVACQPVEESLDRRDESQTSAAKPESNADAKPLPSTDELSEELEKAGIRITLDRPEVQLSLRDGANIVAWEPIEGAVRYDLFYAPLDGNLEQAIRIEGVVSPYTHIKETNINLIYTVVAFDESLTGGSEPAAFTSDVPQGYLAKCLAYTDAARITIDRAIDSAAKGDCYFLSEDIESIISLDLTGGGISDLGPLVDFVNLERLNLSNNLVISIESLALLSNLKALNLSGNANLADISLLSGLTGLQELSLADTAVSDLTAVRELKELRQISLANSPVTSLGALAELRQLQTVDVTGVNVPRNEADCPSISVPANLSEFCLGDTVPTYTDQIQRMMQLHCVSCHNVNNALRANLDSEAETITNATIANMRIQDGSMPPGGALSPSDMRIFANWVSSLNPGPGNGQGNGQGN